MAKKKRPGKLRFSDPILVSVPEFARLSGLGCCFTRQLVAEGKLPIRALGCRRWIIRDEAIAWLRKQPKPGAAA
jgi:hypothetical protein